MEPHPPSPDVLRLLSEANWAEIIPRLTLYASETARHLYWRTGNSEDLADGIKAEDIVHEAIKRVFEGKRKWDPKKDPDLPKFLNDSVISSLFNELAESCDNTKMERFPIQLDESGEEGEAVEPTNIAHHSDPHARELVRPNPTPEEELNNQQEKDFYKSIINNIVDSAKGDAVVEGILLCLMDGISKPIEISEATGFTICEINNGQKRLRRLAEKVRKCFS